MGYEVRAVAVNTGLFRPAPDAYAYADADADAAYAIGIAFFAVSSVFVLRGPIHRARRVNDRIDRRVDRWMERGKGSFPGSFAWHSAAGDRARSEGSAGTH